MIKTVGKVFVLISLAIGGYVIFDLQGSLLIKRFGQWMSQKDRASFSVTTAQAVTAPPEKTAQEGATPVAVSAEQTSPPLTEPPLPELPQRTLITLTTNPAGALLKFNGKRVGESPMRAQLPVGELTKVEISLEGHETIQYEVTPQTNDPIRLQFTLRDLNEPLEAKVNRTEPTESASLVTEPAAAEPGTLATPKKELALVKAKLKKKAGLSVSEEVPEEAANDPDSFFTVQVASVKDLKEASYRAALYHTLGFDAYVCSVDSQDLGSWFRIRIGSFKKKTEASRLAQSLVKEQLESKPWVVHEDGLCPKLVSATPWQEP